MSFNTLNKDYSQKSDYEKIGTILESNEFKEYVRYSISTLYYNLLCENNLYSNIPYYDGNRKKRVDIKKYNGHLESIDKINYLFDYRKDDLEFYKKIKNKYIKISVDDLTNRYIEQTMNTFDVNTEYFFYMLTVCGGEDFSMTSHDIELVEIYGNFVCDMDVYIKTKNFYDYGVPYSEEVANIR